MKNVFKLFISCLICLSLLPITATASEKQSFSTDNHYRETVRAIAEVNFKIMAATYHPDAVFVSEKKSVPISVALEVWKKWGEGIQKEGGSAIISLRFSSRKISETTAFETGIFRYTTIDKAGAEITYYQHIQYLNVKKNGQWLTLMEYQLTRATEAEWNALPAWN